MALHTVGCLVTISHIALCTRVAGCVMTILARNGFSHFLVKRVTAYTTLHLYTIAELNDFSFFTAFFENAVAKSGKKLCWLF